MDDEFVFVQLLQAWVNDTKHFTVVNFMIYELTSVAYFITSNLGIMDK